MRPEDAARTEGPKLPNNAKQASESAMAMVKRPLLVLTSFLLSMEDSAKQPEKIKLRTMYAIEFSVPSYESTNIYIYDETAQFSFDNI
ncbi:hypothetical protein KSC_016610 [Ktedonobacter sp. SOSP1-52]|nr:hypothetical protein KSC_016610 [Ktedonobacter sp. SOSP1-52]